MPTEIVFHSVDELLPFARNSRKHSPEQIELLASVIKQSGWTNPCLIADGGILAGHGRIMAAKKLGLSRVPCIDLSHLSEVERRALIIQDNRLAEFGTSWDLEMLKLETDFLRDEGFDLELTGFDEDALAEMLGDLEGGGSGGGDGDGHGDPDLVPDVPSVPVSRLGDQWIIGDHVVRCGSSLEPDDWAKLMGGEQAQCVWTDPPYNVSLDGGNSVGEFHVRAAKKAGKQVKKLREIKNDSMGDDAFLTFLTRMFECVADVMEPGAPIYVAHSEREGINFRAAFADAGFKFSSCVIWKKQSLVIGLSDHQSIHEPILYGWKPGAGHKWYGGRKITDVMDLGAESPFQKLPDGRWAVVTGDQILAISGNVEIEQLPGDVICVPRPTRSDLHPTMKPPELINRQLRNSALKGDIVVDAFGGSGSTAIAAHQLGMKARLMELSEAYVDVICNRLWAFTGIRPVHALTGEPFPAEGEEREVPPSADNTPDHDIF